MGYTDEEIKSFMSKEERQSFNDWMIGQTGAMNDKGEFLAYPWDVGRFLGMVRQGKVTYWD